MKIPVKFYTRITDKMQLDGLNFSYKCYLSNEHGTLYLVEVL